MTRTPAVQYVGHRVACAALILGAMGLGGCETTTSDNDIVPVTLAEIRQYQADPKGKPFVMLDPRSERAFAEERIAGARHAKLERFSGKKGDIDPAIAAFPIIIVYGDDPSSVAARSLSKKMLGSGYEGVVMYMGGLGEWRRADLPREGTKVGATPAGDAPKP